MDREHSAGTEQRNQHGTVLIWVTLGLLAFFGLAALATDTGRVFTVKSQLQNAADATALAAAGEMRDALGTTLDTAGATVAAQSVGNQHYAELDQVSIPATDIEFGNWPLFDATPVFNPLPGSTDPAQVNAVRVTARRDGTGGSTEVPTVLGRIIGTSSIPVSTVAVAFSGCLGGYDLGELDLPVAVDCCAISGGNCDQFLTYCSQGPGDVLPSQPRTACPDGDTTPGVHCLEFNPSGEQDACWTIYDGDHSSVNTAALTSLVQSGNTFQVTAGEQFYMDNGVKDPVLEDIKDRFNDEGDTDGDGVGDSWVVGLPVVTCQDPGPGCAGGSAQVIEGGVCMEITQMETNGSPKFIKGRFLCPTDDPNSAYSRCGLVGSGGGPGGQCFGVFSEYPVLVQ